MARFSSAVIAALLVVFKVADNSNAMRPNSAIVRYFMAITPLLLGYMVFISNG